MNMFTRKETMFRLQFHKSRSRHYSFSPRKKDPQCSTQRSDWPGHWIWIRFMRRFASLQ